MSKIVRISFVAFLFFLFSTVAKAEISRYVSVGPYLDGGVGLSAGISILPPFVIIPAIDVGVDIDAVDDMRGAFLTAQIGYGIPSIYGYAEWGIGTMRGNFKNSEGVVERQSDNAQKITFGAALGVYVLEIFYEHVRWYSFVDSSAHALGLRARF
ncbi:MAG: hypothetical protein HYT22_00195 [Candidatus Niyogibacteria bacterium]|nr:hypothetical protein [Candidatus Niyogibacteria bacterium]